MSTNVPPGSSSPPNSSLICSAPHQRVSPCAARCTARRALRMVFANAENIISPYTSVESYRRFCLLRAPRSRIALGCAACAHCGAAHRSPFDACFPVSTGCSSTSCWYIRSASTSSSSSEAGDVIWWRQHCVSAAGRRVMPASPAHRRITGFCRHGAVWCLKMCRAHGIGLDGRHDPGRTDRVVAWPANQR